MQELFEKLRKKSKLDEWKPMLAIGIGFMVFLIGMKFMSDNWNAHLAAMQGEMDNRAEEVNNLISKIETITGTNKPLEPEGEDPTKKDSGG